MNLETKGLLLKEYYKYLYKQEGRYPHTKEDLEVQLTCIDECVRKKIIAPIRMFFPKALFHLPKDYIDAVVNKGFRGTLEEFEREK